MLAYTFLYQTKSICTHSTQHTCPPLPHFYSNLKKQRERERERERERGREREREREERTCCFKQMVQ